METDQSISVLCVLLFTHSVHDTSFHIQCAAVGFLGKA